MKEQELLYKIIENTLGQIEPCGSHDIDQERCENFKKYEYIMNCILEDFTKCAKYKNSGFYSENVIGQRAYRVLKDVKEYIEDELRLIEEENQC